MAVTKIRKWCEETAKEFGCSLTYRNKVWLVIKKDGKNSVLVFRGTHLADVQKFFLNEIQKYLGKRMGVIKK